MRVCARFVGMRRLSLLGGLVSAARYLSLRALYGGSVGVSYASVVLRAMR